jgi:hypothetical protein
VSLTGIAWTSFDRFVIDRTRRASGTACTYGIDEIKIVNSWALLKEQGVGSSQTFVGYGRPPPTERPAFICGAIGMI